MSIILEINGMMMMIIIVVMVWCKYNAVFSGSTEGKADSREITDEDV